MAGKKIQKKMIRKKNQEKRSTGFLAQQMETTSTEGMNPALKKQVDFVAAALMKLAHSKETREAVTAQLQSGPPEQSIPATAMMIMSQFKQAATRNNQKVPQDVMLASYVILLTDLIELGVTGGIFQIDMEDYNTISIIMENSLKAFLEAGMKDGSIDPVALQKQVEPLLSETQKQIGMKGAEKSGVPMEPTEEMAQQKILGDAKKPLEEENAKLKGLLAQVQQQQQGNVPQPQAQQQGGR